MGADTTPFFGRSEQIALSAAAAIVPGTFARSLSRRSWQDQGFVTGLGVGATYLLTLVSHENLELAASWLAPSLSADMDPERRQRIALLAVDLSAIPLGVAAQRALPHQQDEPVVRSVLRQAAWRTTVTAGAGAILAAVQGAAGVVERRMGWDGRLTRFPLAVPTGLAFALALEWQRQRELPAEETGGSGDGPEDLSLPESLTAAGAVVVGAGVLAAAERVAAGGVAWVLSSALPGSPRFWRLVGHASVLGLLTAGGVQFFDRAMQKIEAGTTEVDPIMHRIPELAKVGPTISGGDGSLVSWDSLGREGRRHAIAYVRPAPAAQRPEGVPDMSIETVMGRPAKSTPVQVYVGLDGAPTVTERVDLALAEMDRTGAWDRSLIVLVSPTGTGYVNYVATAALQYLTLGDVATVTMQYSKRPSPLSLTKIPQAREQNRLLWLRVVERVRDMPVDSRPRVVLFGESLGAHTSQDVLIHWGTLGPQALGIERALWIGTPYASRWKQEVTRGGRPDVDQGIVAMVNDFAQVEAMPPERRQRLRYVLLSHDNDGVTKFGADLMAKRPDWLGEDRPKPEEVPGSSPRGIPPSMRWRPVATFLQLVVDMKNAQVPGAFRAWAHDYRPDLAKFLNEVFALGGSADDVARVEAAVQQRETVREQLLAPPSADAQSAGTEGKEGTEGTDEAHAG